MKTTKYDINGTHLVVMWTSESFAHVVQDDEHVATIHRRHLEDLIHQILYKECQDGDRVRVGGRRAWISSILVNGEVSYCLAFRNEYGSRRSLIGSMDQIRRLLDEVGEEEVTQR